MIMDVLRFTGCYYSQFRIRRDPELIVTVRWYMCPPNARPLPVAHTFASMIWETDDREYPNDELGELQPPGRFTSSNPRVRRGRPPVGVLGLATPTPLEWFQTGLPAGVVGPYPHGRCELLIEEYQGSANLLLDVAGTWSESELYQGSANLLLGAAGSWSEVPPGQTNLVLTTEDVGNFICSDCTNANGTHTLTLIAPDSWESEEITICGTPHFWRLYHGPLPNDAWVFRLENAGGTAVELGYLLNRDQWDGIGEVTLSRYTEVNCLGPATLTVVPE